jgi:hypothetical protein
MALGVEVQEVISETRVLKNTIRKQTASAA